MEKNELLELNIEGYTAGGEGVAHHEGRAVFIPGTICGEKWRVRIVKAAESGACYGRGEELLSASPERRESGCTAYPRCGGCAVRHMSYAEELRFKLQKVNDALHRIGGLDLTLTEIIPAAENARKRCKVIYNVGTGADGGPIAGFYRPRSHEIIPEPACTQVLPEANRLCAAVLAWMRQEKVCACDEKNGIDGIRHIFVRSSHATGETVLTLMSSRSLSAREEKTLLETLRRESGELTGLVLGVNRHGGNVVLAGELRTLWGSERMTEELCGLRYELSPRSFFQVNPPQAERLYERAVGYAGETGLMMDLYCGTGTISLLLSRRAERVIGVEVIADAVENARQNAARNGIKNTEFLCADAAEAAQMLRDRGERPTCVVVDPPRRGLDAGVVDCIADMSPERVVYVSCDPATLARDLARFAGRGYTAETGCAVDMFPGTSHVETVVLLVRKTPDAYVRIKMDMEDFDLTKSETKATYEEIKAYVKEQTGLNVTNLDIAQTKRKSGIIERENYNLPKSADAKQPQCTKEKEGAILKALKHFQMIQ